MDEGEVVGRGHIRVDARKAEAKLRDHMLVDLHLYACELARVAVALGAKRLDVTHDERAIAFAFAGELAPEAVARARDEVLAGGAADQHPLRLLGIAISAALSLKRVVEVHLPGACVRYVDATEAPAITLAPGTPGQIRVVVRNAFVAAALGRVFGGEPRRELTLLVGDAAGGPLALRIDGEDVPASPDPYLLRVAVDEPEATTVTLDLVATGGGEVLFRERGLSLARYPLAFARAGNRVLPLRLSIDAPRLPTNASRSEVRLGDGLAARVLGRLQPAFDRLLAALATHVVHGGAVDRTVTVGDRAALATALADLAITAAIVGVPAFPSRLAPGLLELPLLDGAFGRGLSIATVLAHRPVHVYTGAQPLGAELAPLLDHHGFLVWRHGRPAERLLDTLPMVASADDLIAQARAGAARRRRALEHPAVEPRLDDAQPWTFRQTFHHDDARFRGLAGEVGIARGAWLATARVFVDGRFLGEMPLPGVKLPIALALAWPGTFVGNLAYDAVERTPAFDAALSQAVRIAALAVGEQLAGDAELVRLACLAWSAASHALGDGNDVADIPRLGDAPVWPLAPGGMTSLRALTAYATSHAGHICTGPGGRGAAIDGRPVVLEAHARLLGEILTDFALVPYGPYLGRRRAGIRVFADPTIHFERPGVEGTILGGTGRHRMYHAGIALGDVPLEGFGRTMDVIWEDDAAIPGEGAVLWRTPLMLDGERRGLERKLRRPVTEGAPPPPDPEPYREVFAPLPPAPPVETVDFDALFPAPRAEPDAGPITPSPEGMRGPPVAPRPSFFGDLVRQVRSLFEPPPEVFAESPLTKAIAEGLSGLALTGRPVDAVVEGTRGRPVRYEPSSRRVIVNARHPAVKKLAVRDDGVTHLVLAATSEINRELAAVTDAEEIAVVLALLR